MVAEITHIAPHVTLADDVLYIDRLTCTDADVVELVRRSDNPEAAVQRALAAGAQMLSMAQVRVDTAVVDQAFTALTREITALMAQTTQTVTTTTADLLHSPEHGINAALDAWHTKAIDLLAATFDPGRTDSAVATLDRVLRGAGERQVEATRRLLNPAGDESPLSQVFGGLRDQIGTVLDAVSRLAEHVASQNAARAATASADERSAVKGLAFEDLVAKVVTDLTSRRGDVTEQVGKTRGSTGSMVGDVVVDVLESAGGRTGRYVLEAKDRRRSMRSTIDELDAAMLNREAGAGIAVFARQEHAPVSEPFFEHDRCAIVVLDKDELDAGALRLACAWARWVVLRDAGGQSENALETERVTALIEAARRALVKARSIRRAHTVAKNSIADAGSLFGELVEQVGSVLDELETLTAA